MKFNDINKLIILGTILYAYYIPLYKSTISINTIINYIFIRIKYFNILRLKLISILPHTNFTLIGNRKNFSIGNGTLFNDNCRLYAEQGKIIIGKNCQFGFNCLLCCATHQPVKERIIRKKTTFKTIKIGDNVWIGANSTIIGGVIIGSNSIVGCNSNVINDIPDNCLYAGICKIYKKNTMNIFFKYSNSYDYFYNFLILFDIFFE